MLLYGKAGGGWVDNNATVTNLTTGASISASNRNSGWVVGAGVEWAIAGNWSAKLEYDFLKLDDLTFGPGPFRGDTFTASRYLVAGAAAPVGGAAINHRAPPHCSAGVALWPTGGRDDEPDALALQCSLLWLGARCARVVGLACQRLSLPQRDAAEHDRPSPWPGRGMFGLGIGRPYPPANMH